MQIIPYGESALLLNFEQEIDPEINRLVQSWEARIRAAKLSGLSHFIPAYASLTLVFEQPLPQVKQTIEEIRQLADQPAADHEQGQRQLRIPVCYADPFALDKAQVMDLLELDWPEVIEWHTQSAFQVYMLGFSPGFAFMGRLPKALHIARKREPRLTVPARSVGLAGAQTGIYPNEIPGGWQLIGRTPISPFRPMQEDIFLFQAGDQVQFYSIDEEEYNRLQTQIEQQQFDWSSLQQK
ncbi:MAG TPA: 5-oxoprolinase subunit PxpB [Saprospiraceae bacterium]|nr:5-oxoprolinase subunit PxpB [Saprospiraceae bacterium]